MKRRKFIGKISNSLGLTGEDRIKEALEFYDWKVYKPPPNTPAYDLIDIKDGKKFMIQVKTDVNNDDKFPRPTNEQLMNHIELAKQYGCTPIYIYYNLVQNWYYATDTNNRLVYI